MSFAVSKPHSSAAGQDAFHSSIVDGGEGGLWQASSPQSRQEVMALCLFDSRVQRVTLLPYSSRVTCLILSLSAYIFSKCLHAYFSGIPSRVYSCLVFLRSGSITTSREKQSNYWKCIRKAVFKKYLRHDCTFANLQFFWIYNMHGFGGSSVCLHRY